MYRSGRADRRATTKDAKEKVKSEEKAKRLEERKAREERENEAKRRRRRDADGEDEDESISGRASQSHSSKVAKAEVSSDTGVRPVPVKCFGEELTPDFDVGKSFEHDVTLADCIWDQPITYELQVSLDEVVSPGQSVCLHYAIYHVCR